MQLNARKETDIVPIAENPQTFEIRATMPTEAGTGDTLLLPVAQLSNQTLLLDKTTGAITAPSFPSYIPKLAIVWGIPLNKMRNAPGLVMVNIDIESMAPLEENAGETFTIDVSTLLRGVVAVTALVTNRGRNFRRISMILTGALALLVPNQEVLKFTYQLYTVPGAAKEGDTLAITASMGVFGQSLFSSVLAYRPAPVPSLKLKESEFIPDATSGGL